MEACALDEKLKDECVRLVNSFLTIQAICQKQKFALNEIISIHIIKPADKG